MIAHLYADESPAARMLDLIARKAPLLMRVGGGALPRENIERSKSYQRTSEKQRERIAELGASGKHTATEIARIVGSSQSVVFKALARAGVKVPDGRTVEMRRRATA